MRPSSLVPLLVGFTAVVGSVTSAFRRRALLVIDPWTFGLVDSLVHLCLVPVYVLFMVRGGLKANVIPALPWAITAAGLNAACTLTFMWALRLGGAVGVVTLLAALSPVLTVGLAALMGEAPTLRQIVGVTLGLAGGYLAMGR